MDRILGTLTGRMPIAGARWGLGELREVGSTLGTLERRERSWRVYCAGAMVCRKDDGRDLTKECYVLAGFTYNVVECSLCWECKV